MFYFPPKLGLSLEYHNFPKKNKFSSKHFSLVFPRNEGMKNIQPPSSLFALSPSKYWEELREPSLDNVKYYVATWLYTLSTEGIFTLLTRVWTSISSPICFIVKKKKKGNSSTSL